MLLKNGAKQAEMDWMDWESFAEDKKSITKSEIQDWINQNRIEVQEVENGESKTFDRTEAERHFNEGREVFGIDSSGRESLITDVVDLDRYEKFAFEEDLTQHEAKYSKWQEPGGENYRELLMTMPTMTERAKVVKTNEGWVVAFPNGVHSIGAYISKKSAEKALAEAIKNPGMIKRREDFNSSHFDEPNILAHVRFNEGTINGERVLFIEEIQSDWAQKGKKEGFNENSIKVKQSGEHWSIIDSRNGEVLGSQRTKEDAERVASHLQQTSSRNSFVPDMPFKNTDQWVNLALVG
jgi:hypothetical protein